MKHFLKSFPTLLTLFLFCSCRGSSPLTGVCTQSSQRMGALREARGEEFIVNDYFSVLDHLQARSGYVLDQVNFADNWGGKPLIYARLVDQEPYPSFAAFMDARGNADEAESSYEVLTLAQDFLSYVEVDGTPEGYLQWVLLADFGDQFDLSWHANYDDDLLLCQKADLDGVRAEFEDWELDIPGGLLRDAGKLDFSPTVVLEDETATIRYLFFTKWGGFIEKSYTITRAAPHLVLESERQVLVEYYSGINF